MTHMKPFQEGLVYLNKNLKIDKNIFQGSRKYISFSHSRKVGIVAEHLRCLTLGFRVRFLILTLGK